MRIVDTHLHLVYPDRFSYPWLAGAPAINRPWSVESYFAEAEPLGIEAALHMEVDVAEADMMAETAFVADLHPRVIGAIAAARPESAEFPAQLEQLAGMDHVRGIRRILQMPVGSPPLDDAFAANIRRLAPMNYTFDLCIRADQLPDATGLVDRCPEVQFVLDHCGVPDIAGGGLDPWRADITELAKRPNVAVKFSGIVSYAGPDWTVDDLRPYGEHVIAAFGWDRVVWGSDHPVCTLYADLTRWVQATHDMLAGAAEEERAALLHGNAERIYRL